ncbi:sensor histidine kinase [Paracoccus bogoriensis]|uniref:sensor histidine kinase n=1 Tax=Paracoccus bogoriensis TaxID=242065 RepID=UPI001CA5D84D|nr:sensor histidine kinase [Paracoccus bogoriensis]MBW7055338.1 sensor histidine kinase [Paracoccus bogoriensis]
MRRITERLDFTRRLGFRLGALLSIAILPIGLISLLQNLHLSREAERNAELALLSRTASAAAGERVLLQSAMRSAEALGPAVLDTLDQPRRCSELMGNFVQRSAIYVAAAFIPADGMARCMSDADHVPPMDLGALISGMVERPMTHVISLREGPISGQPAVGVFQPLFDGSRFLGYTALSISQDLLRSTHLSDGLTEGAHVVSFNIQGELLTSDSVLGTTAASILPRGLDLAALARQAETSFRALSEGGERRVFTVVPVVPDQVYALGSWTPRMAGFGVFQLSRVGAIVLPVALWAVSLAVAYLAVFRLVLRHISVLRGQMRRFAIGARDTAPPVLENAPTEIADVSQTFHNMARILIRDEEAMERAVAEKTVLLKEVHHRVKNNLQLIASIINMQGRLIDDQDAKRVLRSVQDRVAALATIYRNLYQAEQLDAVQADTLLGDIIGQMGTSAAASGRDLDIRTRIDPLRMVPDQAVPLTLLATEAFTNALKYARPRPGEDRAVVTVTLSEPRPGIGHLEVTNSVSEQSKARVGTGLGTQLIEAFAMQLEAQVEHDATEGMHRIAVSFDLARVSQPTGQDPRKVVLTSAARAGSRH